MHLIFFFCQDPLSLSLRLPLQFLNLFMSLKFIVLTLTNFNKHQTFISHMSHDVWFCFFLWRIWQRDQGLLIRLIRWKTLKRYYFPLFLFCQFSCFRKLQVYNTFCLWIIYLSLLGIGVFEYFRSWLKIWKKSRRQRISTGG